ncbi:hypothetical protein [Streptomyces soliscabiei]|uniref:hypothetical protein n=1 Tax=Streptomyces soliscabiei TaxID=588897 RepID=UPI0029A7AC6A|nr:hypothetical protein [Streptomyces sp. NY05-11A]MDX2679999.1 hypothetical protein [Streptomyces sp. NY05-11A]
MADTVTFVDHSKPVLPPGQYEITTTQTITESPEPFAATRQFTVSADRFSLPAARVTAVFPPDGSLGDHHNVLPHVVLDRPTLPWERSPGVEGPWLALLLFSQSQRPDPKSVRLADLAVGPAYFPATPLEAHQSPEDRATVIDVPRDMLEEILPSAAELPYLAHLRRTEGAPDVAVVLGNRLPPANESSTVHLVSLEGRYGADGFDLGPDGPGSFVRLVSLASWRFACVAENQNFATLVRDLAQHGSPLRLPDSGNAAADDLLRQGQIPVRHTLRQGGTTVSWYRGPLTTGPVAVTPLQTTRDSDRLLRFHPDIGMFETGYAAAWELGRLLALQSTDYATALYDWKRRRSQKRLRATLEPTTGYPLDVPDIDDALPDTVRTWLTGLAGLSGVPLMYLVPDERLLPVESIRFVSLDQQWIRHLLDGAFSIGRLTAADAELDRSGPPMAMAKTVTGALIRSGVVSGYPGLVIEAFGRNHDLPLEQISTTRLTPDIMLCLFAGTLTRLDVRQRPEAVHFAVELPDDGRFGKSLRDPDGTSGPALTPLPLGPGGRLPIGDLADSIAATMKRGRIGSGDFARQMIETAERVSFLSS